MTQNLRDYIIANVERAQARGITIGHDWGIEVQDGAVWTEMVWGAIRLEPDQKTLRPPCVCPMGAVLCDALVPQHPGNDYEGLVADKLGVEGDWVCAFLNGYDACRDESYMTVEAKRAMDDGDPLLVAGYELGVELRERFAPL